jgi:hypothetical protein
MLLGGMLGAAPLGAPAKQVEVLEVFAEAADQFRASTAMMEGCEGNKGGARLGFQPESPTAYLRMHAKESRADDWVPHEVPVEAPEDWSEEIAIATRAMARAQAERELQYERERSRASEVRREDRNEWQRAFRALVKADPTRRAQERADKRERYLSRSEVTRRLPKLMAPPADALKHPEFNVWVTREGDCYYPTVFGRPTDDKEVWYYRSSPYQVGSRARIKWKVDGHRQTANVERLVRETHGGGP